MIRRSGSSLNRAGGRARGFSLVELSISVLIIAVLIGLLAPMLKLAGDVSRRTLCAGNLRQMSIGWQLYLEENQQFPQYISGQIGTPSGPDWEYAGVEFVGTERQPVLDSDRPINNYLFDEAISRGRRFSELFHCPSDRGVFERGGPPNRAKLSVLPGAKTCFEFFGNSYRANPYLLDSTAAGIDQLGRPLRVSEVAHVGAERLLLVGDPVWYYATRRQSDPDAPLDASWHMDLDSGNMLALDGSVRFLNFRSGKGFTLMPRPDLDAAPLPDSFYGEPRDRPGVGGAGL